MKIRQMTVDEKDIYNSFKVAVIGALIGYGKLYELLHKQLVRKGRARYADYSFTYRGRTVKPLMYYDIKSQYAEPYSRDGVALGLNQLFMGQNPYKQFQGDTADDGIYHDTCHIVLKRAGTLATYDTYGWHIDGYGEIPSVTKFGENRVRNLTRYEKYHVHYTTTVVTSTTVTTTTTDEDGNEVTETHTDTSTDVSEDDGPSFSTEDVDPNSIDLTTETYTSTSGDTTVTTTITKTLISDGWYIDVYYTSIENERVEEIRIGTEDNLVYTNLSSPPTHEEERVDDSGESTYTYTEQVPDWKPMYKHFRFEDFTNEHGEVKKIINMPDFLPSLYGDGEYIKGLIGLSYLLGHRTAPETRLVIFKSGTAFLVTSSYKYEEYRNDDTIVKEQPAGYRIVPLVYTDTGDLTISHVEFIDTWDERFELKVVEDSYWYSGLIEVVMIMVSMAVTYFFAVAAGFSANVVAAATVFAGIGAIGSVAGSKFLEILGILGGLVATVEGVGTKLIAKEAMTKGLSERAATRIAMEATFGEAARAFFSTVGFSNMLTVGKAALSIYFTLDTPGKPEIDTQEDMTEDRMKLVAMDSSDDYINDVIDLDKDDDIDDYLKI